MKFPGLMKDLESTIFMQLLLSLLIFHTCISLSGCVTWAKDSLSGNSMTTDAQHQGTQHSGAMPGQPPRCLF